MTSQINACTAAIEFALEDATGEGMVFLRCWLYGDFDVIRKEWPEAPESVYIGADPLHPETVAMLEHIEKLEQVTARYELIKMELIAATSNVKERGPVENGIKVAMRRAYDERNDPMITATEFDTVMDTILKGER